MATYTDFFNNFLAHPDTHDLASKSDSRAIAQSIQNLIFTNKFERPFRPRLGSNVRASLFEEVSDQRATVLESSIKEIITNYEKRVIVKDVTVIAFKPQRKYEATIAYYELNNPNISTLRIQLNRVR